MKIQSLAVIALLIIIPMTIILTNYSKNQIRTLQFQISYDTKLKTSTYDAIKAFQLNMSNNTMSDISNSKMRDIEAAINVFYSSLASNFNMTGYGEDVPAIVYTLYDGYYIYSSYNNTLTEDIDNKLSEETSIYKNGEIIYGFKPYIYYSCRYVKSGVDVVITYSLDSYISVQGTINGVQVNEAGYLLSGVDKADDRYTYNGIEISNNENGYNLQENVYDEEINDEEIEISEGNTILAKKDGGDPIKYPQMKINGVKYYYDNSGDGQIFSMVNDNKHKENTLDMKDSIENNSNGYKFYEEAYSFKQRILGYGENGSSDPLHSLLNLSSLDAVDINGNKYSADVFTPGIQIFGELQNGTIEDKDSNFYMHRTEVIKNAIESNLMVAIDNYNNVSSVSTQFAMPKLTEEDWQELTNGISMITFLQGLNIGGKIYNGYAIVNNDINDDYVAENSIYITDGSQYYRVTDEALLNNMDLNNSVGIINSDFEVKTIVDTITTGIDGEGNLVNITKDVYYYPRPEMAAYTSVVNPGSSQNSRQSISEYLKDAKNNPTSNLYKLAQIYYTGLGRERYGMYRPGKELK